MGTKRKDSAIKTNNKWFPLVKFVISKLAWPMSGCRPNGGWLHNCVFTYRAERQLCAFSVNVCKWETIRRVKTRGRQSRQVRAALPSLAICGWAGGAVEACYHTLFLKDSRLLKYPNGRVETNITATNIYYDSQRNLRVNFKFFSV